MGFNVGFWTVVSALSGHMSLSLYLVEITLFACISMTF